MRWSAENLSEVVAESKCVSDVCFKLGITSTQSNYKTFYKYVDRYGIDISHFDGRQTDKMKRGRTQQRLDDSIVFVENSTYPQAPLRKRVIKYK